MADKKLSEKLRQAFIKAYHAERLQLPAAVTPELLAAAIVWCESSPRIEKLLAAEDGVSGVRLITLPLANIDLSYSAANPNRLDAAFSQKTFDRFMGGLRRPLVFEPAVVEDLADGRAGLMDANTRTFTSALAYLTTIPAYAVTVRDDETRERVVHNINRLLNGEPPDEAQQRLLAFRYCLDHGVTDNVGVRAAAARYGCKNVDNHDSLIAWVKAQNVCESLRGKVNFDLGMVPDSDEEKCDTGGRFTRGIFLQLGKLVATKPKLLLLKLVHKHGLKLEEVRKDVSAALRKVGEDEDKLLAYFEEVRRQYDSGERLTAVAKPVGGKPGMPKENASAYGRIKAAITTLSGLLTELPAYDLWEMVPNMEYCQPTAVALRQLADKIDTVVAKFDRAFPEQRTDDGGDASGPRRRK